MRIPKAINPARLLKPLGSRPDQRPTPSQYVVLLRKGAVAGAPLGLCTAIRLAALLKGRLLCPDEEVQGWLEGDAVACQEYIGDALAIMEGEAEPVYRDGGAEVHGIWVRPLKGRDLARLGDVDVLTAALLHEAGVEVDDLTLPQYLDVRRAVGFLVLAFRRALHTTGAQ